MAMSKKIWILGVLLLTVPMVQGVRLVMGATEQENWVAEATEVSDRAARSPQNAPENTEAAERSPELAPVELDPVPLEDETHTAELTAHPPANGTAAPSAKPAEKTPVRPSIISSLFSSLPPMVIPSLFHPEYDFPSFNSQRLDQELHLYHRYLQVHGTPDVLIVGSSRSLQGIDPTALQQALEQRGYKDAKVFNFGINGATAQVVDLLLRQVLTPEQMPKLILWGDGSRAFNNGRPDATYSGIKASPGYQRISNGDRPIPQRVFDLTQLNPVTAAKSLTGSPRSPLPADLTEQGFNSLNTRYDPTTYFQSHPRVSGLYDSNYVGWSLAGTQQQATKAIANFANTQNIPLAFISLPLTADLLEDETRYSREQEFLSQMTTLAKEQQFIFRDYSQHPQLIRPDYFVDPSHINRYGARAIAFQLAVDPQIPWHVLK